MNECTVFEISKNLLKEKGTFLKGRTIVLNTKKNK